VLVNLVDDAVGSVFDKFYRADPDMIGGVGEVVSLSTSLASSSNRWAGA
jgi:hypothetical protein